MEAIIQLVFYYQRNNERSAKSGLMLLHTGGLELQELYFTLANEEDEIPFTSCVGVLDQYFIPKVNLPFERHQFRQIIQAPSEKVDKFVSRLRQKATTCEFHSVDEAIRNQFIEKCLDSKLRRKFLERSNAILKDLQDVARVYEAVEEQLKSMESSHTVNALDQNACGGNAHWNNGSSAPKRPGGDNRQRCYNCNRTGHFARDSF